MMPHNEARKGDYADVALLPGDPDRAAWIAQTLLDGARRVNSIRGELGSTGSYRGMPVSVQSTGIGRPSLSIYMHELVSGYGVGTIVRIGSCGALDTSIGLRSLVIAQSAAMDFEAGDAGAWCQPDEALFATACAEARAGGFEHHVCPMVSSDTFYHPEPLGRFATARERGAMACDMETAAILAGAPALGARALSICTVVDSLVSREEIDISERQAVFEPMARLALETVFSEHQSTR